MTTARATLIGAGAILLWSFLALFTVGTAPIPPFQLNALCFSIGGVLGLIWVSASGDTAQLRHVPLRIYLFGTAGLFGYHALYFAALRLAPAAEAGLIAYLWPLLIVLFSGFLPGERLRIGHALGAVIGFSGAAVILVPGLTGLARENLPGYGLALLCALTWSGYSVLSRRLGTVPTASVAVFCCATAVLSLVAHLIWEDTVWPTAFLGWASILGLGLGPVGLAFYIWDVGVKRGNIQILGTASYAAPLISTIVLVLAGVAPASPGLGLAALLVTGGALLAARASRTVGSGGH